MKKKTNTLKKTDYSFYRMSAAEMLISGLTGFAGGAAACYIFYSDIVLSVAFGLIAVIFALLKGNTFFRNKRNRKLLMEFKDFLEIYTSSLSSGKNAVFALSETQSDLAAQYGEKSLMAAELKNILSEINNGCMPEETISDFAERSGMQDIKNFAETFRLCRTSGGNLKEAVYSTYSILSEKTKVQGEIEAIVSKGKNEMKIMTFLPLAVLPVMKTLGETGASSDFTVTAVKTAGAVIIVTAYFIGKKISDIKI